MKLPRPQGDSTDARRSLTPLTAMISVVVAATWGLVFVTPAAASFGLSSFSFSATEQPSAGSKPGVLGTPDTQAGSHPWAVTTSFAFNHTTAELTEETVPDSNVKDIRVEIPAGLVGNTNALPQCGAKQLTTPPNPPVAFVGQSCPANTQIGVVEVRTLASLPFGLTFGIFNMVPPPGVPAQFGFNALGVPVLLAPSVRTNGDYGVTVSSNHTSEGLYVFSAKTTFWGVPGDSSHDEERGTCLSPFYALGGSSCSPAARQREKEEGEPESLPIPSGLPPTPFLTLPTDCPGAPMITKIHVDSWQEPGRESGEGTADLSDPRWKSMLAESPQLSGCGRLGFSPSIKVAPDTTHADTPAGLTADVKMPQEGLANPGGLVAPSDLKNTTVVLPEGVAINPGQAAGLAACQLSEDGVGTEGPPSCPAASKVGTDVITTPLLADKLEGNVYVLQSDPPNLKLLVSAYADGVYVKLVGTVRLDQATGRLTTTFAETPQLPFTDFKLQFSGGSQAALVTPPGCGTYTTSVDFTPWTSPFADDVLGSDSFAIGTGPGGSPCASPLPFSPSLIAGSTTDQAGGFTNFSLLLQRADGQQRVSTLQFKTPAGLLGMISKVPLCGEPQASKGECPAASQIGHTVVQAGPGPYPLVVPEPGRPAAPIYLTGSYKGAPYGLSIKVPLLVGPFDLGTEVVRSRIEVDPHTAQLTVTTDPLPAIIRGVPADLRAINAVIDRPEFMFNPTNCSPQSFSGTATSTEGATAPIASHFQVGACQSLRFKPGFKVSTSGKTSKANGASIDAKVIYPPVAAGANQASSQANIASVKVELPKQLPSRLTTLQKACLAATFNANPANCPAASVVGIARANTPVLPVQLKGPVYFVSNGGEAFPNLVIVLQGYGVRVDLVGDTFISKAGITSSTFKQVPDVPISSFELYLPEGKHSALAASTNLCKTKLTMPATFTAQNGLVVKQNTKIAVTGCGKAKRPHKASKVRRARGAGHAQRMGGRS
jgi:hypothetical protein